MGDFDNLKPGVVVAIGRRVGRMQEPTVLRLDTVKRVTPTQIICTIHGTLTAEERYKKSGQALSGLSSILRIATDDDKAHIAAKQRKAADSKAALETEYKKRESLRDSFPEGWFPGISSGLNGEEFEVTFHLTEKQIKNLAKMLWKARSILEDKVAVDR